MKGKSLIIWIILLNIFDCSICLTTVWLRKLLLDPDTPLSCSPHTLWKFRLRFRQLYNSGPYRDIWRKAEVKNCSGQTVTFDILLTTENCSLPSSFPVTLSLYLLERQSAGLNSKKMFTFHLPGCVSLNTTLTVDHMIESGGTRVLVGYENGPRNLKESDRKLLNKNSRQTILTGAILSRSFQDDLRRRAALKRDSKLSLESFTESKSESDLTPFGSLQEATKLGRKFLQAAFLNDTEKTNTTIDKRLETVSRDSLNNPHLDGTSLPAQLLGETSENRDKNKSGNVKSTENTVRKKSDLDSNLNPQLLNNISSVSSFSFRLTPTDIRKNFISSSTSVIPNSSRNTAIELPVLESSTKAEFTSKQGKVISLLNTKALASTYQTVKPFRISTTTDPQIRTSRQPELSSLPTTDTTTLIIATDLKPKVKQTSTTIYKTSKSKHITSPLRTSAADTNIITTISTDVESTASSLTGSTIQTTRTQQQTTFPERTPTSKQKSTDYGRSAVTTSSSQPTTTTTIKEITSSLSLATSKTPTYETPVTTRRIVTVISESPTWSSRLSTSVTTSALTTSFWKNVTISNSSVPANTSTNSTLENETTTFLSQRTHENEVQEEEDAYFWPLVLSLVIGIPAIIVFSIAMVVITKKRNIDSSTFFLGSPMADEEV